MSEIINEKEKLLLEFIVSSRELFIKTISVIKPEYFDSPLDNTVKFVIDYFEKYHNVPDISIINVETNVTLILRDVAKDEFDYISDEIESLCKQEAMKIAILSSADILNTEEPDYGEIDQQVRNALLVSIDKNLGVDYFDNPALRLLMMQENIDSRSIGWKMIDMILDDIRRGEMGIFAGFTGSGKSVVLANIAKNLINDNLSGLIISLELNESLVCKRVDSIVTGIPTREVFDSVEEVNEHLESMKDDCGSLFIKKMSSGTTANDIRSYLSEYEIQFGYVPDFICLDYLDLMGTNQKVSGNVFDVDKVKSEELREIANDYNCYLFTASQLNRDSDGVDNKRTSHIAGGLSKANTCDFLIALTRSQEQIDANEIHFQPLKIRNACNNGEHVVMYWNPDTLEITEKRNKPLITKTSNSKSKERLGSIMKRSKNR